MLSKTVQKEGEAVSEVRFNDKSGEGQGELFSARWPVGVTKASLPTHSPCNYEAEQNHKLPSELELSLPPPPPPCGLK